MIYEVVAINMLFVKKWAFVSFFCQKKQHLIPKPCIFQKKALTLHIESKVMKMETEVTSDVRTMSNEQLKDYMPLDEMHTRLTQSIHDAYASVL